MPAKRITIVLLSDGASKVRQLKISRLFIGFLCLLFISSVSILPWTLKEYWTLKGQVSHLSLLQKENKQEKKQLVALSHKISQINKKMTELKAFDRKLKIMVNLDTNDDNTHFLGIGGSDPALLNPEYAVEKAHRKLVRVLHKSLDSLSTEVDFQINEKAELYKFLQNQKSLLACTPSIWPVRGWLSSTFGGRISPFTGQQEFHSGIDICTRNHTLVVSPADGIVSSIDSDYGYGKMLFINHGNGIKTKYAHLDKILVKKGQYVKRGQEIALVGTTGRTTGPHLHYEVALNGVPVDPARYILN